MNRAARATIALASALLASAVLGAAAAPAQQFGLHDFDFTFSEEDGGAAFEAGSHPFAATVSFKVNTKEEAKFAQPVPVEEVKDLELAQVLGLAGDPNAVPRCSNANFVTQDGGNGNATLCPNATVLGAAANVVLSPQSYSLSPVYNLAPPPGVAARIGFRIANVPVTIDLGLRQELPYDIVAKLTNVPQGERFYATATTLWGNPADEAHDPYRGKCLAQNTGTTLDELGEALPELRSTGSTCPVTIPERPFITLPRGCAGPLTAGFKADSWQTPGAFVSGSASVEEMVFCDKLGFNPEVSAQTTDAAADTASGLDFSIEFDDPGLTSPSGTAQSDIAKAVVTMPEGITANPSIAEGLGVCTPADLDRETISSAPGTGCPNASKIGTVSVRTPLLDEPIDGSVYLAAQNDNPFNTLLAFYIVLKNPGLGVLVKLPAKVTPDPNTGQLVTTVEDIAGFPVPQVPFSRFDFHFREGARAPLVTPPTCGTKAVQSQFTSRSGKTVTRSSSFEITSGPGGSPCPPGGLPPFHPGFEAGSINSTAGAYSPFNFRLTRADGEQDMTKFSAVLPHGVTGKLAGVAKCPDAAIAAAGAKSGRSELASPSCPAGSKIGRTLAGAGVGSQLTYVPGSLYLAGPYKGDPLSVVAITPAVAGPFDVGTVVVRVALTVNPVTAEVEADGAASDPIPHILAGIPLKLRDLRVYTDRPEFMLNPTSCEPFATQATLFGGGSLLSPADDSPVSLSARFQASSCASLGFKPRLNLQLKGATRRGGFPALRGTFLPRPGNANLKGLVLRLPHSAFLEQSHIRTICTRVQFAAKSCPQGAIYGHARAFTPLLDEPLEGPVYLRSSSNPLPDFVADLHGLVDIEAVARIDSKNGGIRATFLDTPDAPLSKVVVNMQGGRKGLIVNSVDLCAHPQRANASFTGHNGRRHQIRPKVVAMGCKKKGKAKRSAHKR